MPALNENASLLSQVIEKSPGYHDGSRDRGKHHIKGFMDITDPQLFVETKVHLGGTQQMEMD